MKEPKMAVEVPKKKTIKKSASPKLSKSQLTVVISDLSKKHPSSKIKRPNFTLIELTRTAQTELRIKKVAAQPVTLNELPQSVPALSVLPPHRQFSRVTEVVGIGMAVFGLSFAVVFGAGMLTPQSQRAQVIDSGTATSTYSTTTGQVLCQYGQVLMGTTCVNPKPPVTFVVPGDHANVKGVVPVQATVDNATRVKLSVYSKDTGASLTVGVMNKVNATTFSFDWPTNNFHDGVYFLLATVENQFGSYDVSDTAQQLTVINNAPVSTNEVIGTTDTPYTITSQPAPPTLTSNVLESATQVNFSVKISNTQSVVLYARLLPNGGSIPIGSGYRYSDTEWRYSWLLAPVAVGEYSVTAQAMRTDNTLVQTPSLTIKRLMDTAPTATSAPGTLPVSASTTATTSPTLTPTVSALTTPTSPVSGVTQFKIQVSSATKVQLYAQNKNSLVNATLGTTLKADSNVWLLTYDSKLLPDGDYTLVTAVTNSYGIYESRPLTFTVKNRVDVVPTPLQADEISVINDVAKSVSIPVTSTSKSSLLAPLVVTSSTTAIVIQVIDAAIEPELKKLAAALRVGDTVLVQGIKNNINSLAKYAIYQTIGDANATDLIKQANQHVIDVIAQTESNVVTIDKILADRTGENASKDSDNDGIPDFDEITIYKTNPFVADTDNDGFLDGAEIMSGYNPRSAKAEVLVAYESPKVAGVEETDLLAVHSVSTATPVPDTATTTTPDEPKHPIALISGKAPANSFVTLYIFSTPIIVTIKTDADGGWNYHFDKELENGTHEVYVGVTDNAGKIVAKSAPFTFIKTAEAYSGQKEITDAVVAPLPVEHNLLSNTIMYVLGGLSVSLIGLLLFLIGVRFDSRRRIIENIVA